MASKQETTDLERYDRALAEGLAAYRAGLSVQDCPYSERGSAQREGWLDGWNG